VGTPTSYAAWVHTTLPISRAGAGSPSRPMWRPWHAVMQFLGWAELMLGCDRRLVFPLATEAGLLYAFNARLPPPLEPLESWTRTAKV